MAFWDKHRRGEVILPLLFSSEELQKASALPEEGIAAIDEILVKQR